MPTPPLPSALLPAAAGARVAGLDLSALDPLFRGTASPDDASAAADAWCAAGRQLAGQHAQSHPGLQVDPKEHGYSPSSWKPGCPRGVVAHLSAHAGGTEALDAGSVCFCFMKRGAGASTNGVVGTNGTIASPVHLLRPSWHACAWNYTHLGLDLVGPGPVELHGGKYYRPGTVDDGKGGRAMPWQGKRYHEPAICHPDGTPLTAEEVVDFGAPAGPATAGTRQPTATAWPWGCRRWHLPPLDQVLAAVVFLRAALLLHAEIDARQIIRHAQIPKADRCDPGPLVPLEWMRLLAANRVDLAPIREDLAQPGAWRAWVLGQWREPCGTVIDADRLLPGRPRRNV